jgi:DNA-binding NarL/FixJ family response regulator
VSAVAVHHAMTAGILSSRPLWGEAVARALEGEAVSVSRGDSLPQADVLVVVEATDTERGVLREIRRPAVALVAQPPSGDALLELVEAGVHAVLSTGCEPSELACAVRRVADGGTGLTGGQVRLLAEAVQARSQRDALDLASITKREREILVAIEGGLSVKQTAVRLEISPRTVENTQRLLFCKLGVRNRSQAVARALGAGLLGSRAGEEPS